MQTNADAAIEQAERQLANPTVHLRQAIKDKTADAVEGALVDGAVQIWATVKADGASTGVQSVGEFTLSEIYGYSQSAAIAFASEAASIGKDIAAIISLKDNEIEFDIKVTSLLGRIKKINRFIGISQQHDELISSFQQLVASEAVSITTTEKLVALKSAFEKLGLKVRLSDKTLDDFYDALELVGFDFSPVF